MSDTDTLPHQGIPPGHNYPLLMEPFSKHKVSSFDCRAAVQAVYNVHIMYQLHMTQLMMLKWSWIIFGSFHYCDEVLITVIRGNDLDLGQGLS